MQPYSENTSRIYSDLWGRYAHAFGRAVLRYLDSLHEPLPSLSSLDLACGTGDLAQMLAASGRSVVGLDLSPAMLARASELCGREVAGGQVRFVRADMANFAIGDSVSLVTCSYDSINHLPTKNDLTQCFENVAKALEPGGLFIFDMNTRRGLEDWNRIQVLERASYTVVSRGFYNPQEGRAWKKFSGFRKTSSGLFEKFEQLIFNQAFDVATVSDALEMCGLVVERIGLLDDLSSDVDDPEGVDRVVIVANHPKSITPRCRAR